jgi:hypothetical protein
LIHTISMCLRHQWVTRQARLVGAQVTDVQSSGVGWFVRVLFCCPA